MAGHLRGFLGPPLGGFPVTLHWNDRELRGRLGWPWAAQQLTLGFAGGMAKGHIRGTEHHITEISGHYDSQRTELRLRGSVLGEGLELTLNGRQLSGSVGSGTTRYRLSLSGHGSTLQGHFLLSPSSGEPMEGYHPSEQPFSLRTSGMPLAVAAVGSCCAFSALSLARAMRVDREFMDDISTDDSQDWGSDGDTGSTMQP